MGLFGDKDAIVGAALGAGGAFNKGKKIDKGAVFGAAMGASIASGKKWTLEDSLKLGAVVASMDDKKEKQGGYYVVVLGCLDSFCYYGSTRLL